MEKTVSMPVELYNRLASLARGFDTPADVISRLIDVYDSGVGSVPLQPILPSAPVAKRSTALEIVLSPEKEEDFKRAFLRKGTAMVKIYKMDGTCTVNEWRLNRFSADSSVKGNLMSGRLRGWKDKGIYKAEVMVVD